MILISGRIYNRTRPCNPRDFDRHPLAKSERISLICYNFEFCDEIGRANQFVYCHCRNTVLQKVFFSSHCQPTGIIKNRFVLCGLTKLFEGRKRHSGQKDDDDDDDHDFDNGKALRGVVG